MKTRISLILIFIGFIPFQLIVAQNQINYSAISKLKCELDLKLNDSAPGAAILFMLGDSVIFEDYYGMADIENAVKLGPEHKMGIASVSKQFEGMALLLLEEKGLLSLDDDIRKYFAEYPLGDEKISLRQLLSHSSGLPELTQNKKFMSTIGTAHTVEEIILTGLNAEFLNKPGVNYQYCNTGYTIIVALIEKVSGMKYSVFLKNNFFDPLGMKNTYSCDAEHDAKDIVPRYYADSTGFIRAEEIHFSNLIGGGGIISNVRDLAIWNRALLTGKGLPSNYKTIWKPNALNNGDLYSYGLGMGISEFEGIPFYYHPGMGSGMNSINLIYPDYDLSMVVIRNVSKPDVTSVDLITLASQLLFTLKENEE